MSKTFITLVLGLVLITSALQAQSTVAGIDVFGYFQVYYMDSRPNKSSNSRTFDIQQVDLFFSKDLGSGFSAFVNFELTNSYSSERRWGSFNLEEVWLRYSYSPELNVKFGQLIPSFNNLNEIKNRTPLLPYISRPLIYETSYSSTFDFKPYFPERANLQVYGALTVGEIKADYAVYLGNSDANYTFAGTGRGWTSGYDTTKFKLFGTRVGIRTSGLKAGVSTTWDRYRGLLKKDYYGVITADKFVGNIPRFRVGLDLSYNDHGFFFESEYVSVQHTLDQTAESYLNTIAKPISIPAGPGKFITMDSPYNNSLDKTFYYANLGYDITDQWFLYGGYSFSRDHFEKTYKNVKLYTFGGGFRATDNVVLKTQYVRMDLGEIPMMGEYWHGMCYVAVSVMF